MAHFRIKAEIIYPNEHGTYTLKIDTETYGVVLHTVPNIDEVIQYCNTHDILVTNAQEFDLNLQVALFYSVKDVKLVVVDDNKWKIMSQDGLHIFGAKPESVIRMMNNFFFRDTTIDKKSNPLFRKLLYC